MERFLGLLPFLAGLVLFIVFGGVVILARFSGSVRKAALAIWGVFVVAAIIWAVKGFDIFCLEHWDPTIQECRDE